jgi:integrase
MTANSSVRRKRRKASNRPDKPYSKYPLYAHSLGYWSAKVNGRILHFGRWGRVVKGRLELLPYEENWRAALAAYEKLLVANPNGAHVNGYVVDPDVPLPNNGKRVLGELCDKFLAKKRADVGGKIGTRMYDEYKSITDLIIKQFGNQRAIVDLTAADFESLRADMAGRWGLVRLGNSITRVKTVFKYAYEIGLIDKPIPCLQPHSSIFAKPTAAELRKHRAKNGKRMLEAAECRKLLDALDGREVVASTDAKGKPVKVTLERDPQLRAMILLGLNCGFGNHDCATLPLSALDLDSGWINYPRPKTGVERRCPLWTDTVAALREAIAERPQANDGAADLVFITSRGRAWLSRGIANPVSVATRAAMRAVGIHRAGIGHYTLRHVFRTAADGARDQVAANAIMGHVDPSMAAVYREGIDDTRLRAVVDYVHGWLFGAKGGAK